LRYFNVVVLGFTTSLHYCYWKLQFLQLSYDLFMHILVRRSILLQTKI